MTALQPNAPRREINGTHYVMQLWPAKPALLWCERIAKVVSEPYAHLNANDLPSAIASFLQRLAQSEGGKTAWDLVAEILATNTPVMIESPGDPVPKPLPRPETFAGDDVATPLKLALWVLEENTRPFFGGLSLFGEALARRLSDALPAGSVGQTPSQPSSKAPSDSELSEMMEAIQTLETLRRSSTQPPQTSPEQDADG